MELRRIYFICIITVMCAIIAAMSAASAASTISVEPSYQSVSHGATFTVNITVDPDGNNVSGVDYIFCFNNTMLNATSLTSGEFFGGFNIDTYGEGINNTAGTVDYCELMKAPITEGVTTPGTFTTITFQAIGEHGIGDLYFKKVTLSDPDGYKIPNVANSGRVGIAQTQSPFVINGYVFNEDESDCDDSTVNITNLNTGKDWTAETSGNNYQLTLSSCADVIADEILRFNVTSLDGSSNITEHTVTQAEVGDGGFELNITLEGSGVFDPAITSCNSTGAGQDEFYPGDSVWVAGTGLAADTDYNIWIQPDPVNDSDTLDSTEDPSGSQETVTTDADGNFGPIEIWSNIPAGSPMNYDIVVDDQDGTYNEASDGIDSANGVVGIVAPIPELASIALLAVGLLMLMGLMRFRREE